MTTGYLIALGLGLFAIILIGIIGCIGTIEAINEQNERAKWEQWSKQRRENSQSKVMTKKKQDAWHMNIASVIKYVGLVVIL